MTGPEVSGISCVATIRNAACVLKTTNEYGIVFAMSNPILGTMPE